MARTEALAPKFKRVETAIRKVLQDFTGVTEEIDAALEGKRSAAEITLMKSLRKDNGAIHKKAQEMLFKLYGGVEK